MKKEKIKAIDIIKAFAIISVLILHVNVPYEFDKKFFLSLYTLVSVQIFIIITGYNYTASYMNRKITLKTWYGKYNLQRKLKRILIPYILIVIFETIILYIKVDYTKYRNLRYIGTLFLEGGLGPGSYYTPVLVQIVFIYFPLLLIFNNYLKNTIDNIKKRYILSLVITIVFEIIYEIIYEIIINYIGKDYNEFIQEFYRISAFRYLPFLQLGIILYYNKKEMLNKISYMLPFSIVGVIYIYLTYYKDKVIYPFYYWKPVALPTLFYALFFILIIMRYFRKTEQNFLEKVVIIIGRASYHICLFQMAYFGVLKLRLSTTWYSYIIHILICLIVGVIFYYIESKLTRVVSVRKAL